MTDIEHVKITWIRDGNCTVIRRNGLQAALIVPDFAMTGLWTVFAGNAESKPMPWKDAYAFAEEYAIQADHVRRGKYWPGTAGPIKCAA